MKVLLVNHRFWPADGGTERWTLALARALQGRGHRVSVLTQNEPQAPAEEEVDGIAVRRLPMRQWGQFRVPRAYWRTLRAMDFDLLHMSGNRIWCADFYFPVAQVFDGPQVITPHGFYQWEMDPSPRNRWYFGRYLPQALRAFDLYLALTEHEREQVIGFGYPGSRVRLVGEGIDLKDLTAPVPPLGLREKFGFTRPRIALYVGGLWENKRVDRLVEALAPLRDHVALGVVGKDLPGTRYDRTHVEALAKQRGLEVRFLGYLEHNEVRAALREVDLYVQGSQYEGFGISLLEATASGLPFVAFEAGAARYLAEDGGGRVARSVEEFTSSVREILDRPGLRGQMSDSARRTAKRWDWEVVVDRYLDAYKEAMGRA
ncbi:MAG: glycosyltransferase family 4 protein [Euryarchaeota archaeon]|nr:glycosyltransferase family 4 protein [Euryarchaeota archaeon]MDE1835352.1 glycosyltransferase family 4 protein [Euryarchaeota archaeon]MDE1880753.1 glycosyltransferase family 4 protein [Euryarchaeota archaeon]MDE2043648.1 glycosyltransferase family 4 protein [Thermoplasmata archaeon]